MIVGTVMVLACAASGDATSGATTDGGSGTTTVSSSAEGTSDSSVTGDGTDGTGSTESTAATTDDAGATSTGGPDLEPWTCEAGSRDGSPDGAIGELSPGGVDYNVAPPPGYQNTVGYPLLVVFAPAGVTDPVQNEQFTGLGPDAHARGYVVAFVNHTFDYDDVGAIPGQISQKWCIDERRIYLTGHSDGGSMATIIPLLGTEPLAAAIAPSAAGVSYNSLVTQGCPTETFSVMVMHSANDAMFPGRGLEAAGFWSGCNECAGAPVTLPDGCIAPTDGCAGGTEVRYCEGTAPHGVWPDMNDSMFAFFERFVRA